MDKGDILKIIYERILVDETITDETAYLRNRAWNSVWFLRGWICEVDNSVWFQHGWMCEVDKSDGFQPTK